MTLIEWFSDKLEWIIYVVGGIIAFIYNWLNGKITKLETKIGDIERDMLHAKLEASKTFVTRVDLDKFELKIDRLYDNVSELKDKLLTKD